MRDFRSLLDYGYHDHYSSSRKDLQDSVINRIVCRSFLPCPSDRPTKVEGVNASDQWIIMTAGPMGSGKSTVLKWMRENNIILSNSSVELNGRMAANEYAHLEATTALVVCPLFIRIDMDEIREMLPESELLKEKFPRDYGARTQKEAGCIAELCVLTALSQGNSIVIDGSMTDLFWQAAYVDFLRSQFPNARMLLMHVTASEDIVQSRVAKRSVATRRMIPDAILKTSMKLRDFSSLREIAKKVDIAVSVDNSSCYGAPVLVHPWHMTWDKLHSAVHGDVASPSVLLSTARTSATTGETIRVGEGRTHSFDSSQDSSGDGVCTLGSQGSRSEGSGFSSACPTEDHLPLGRNSPFFYDLEPFSPSANLALSTDLTENESTEDMNVKEEKEEEGEEWGSDSSGSPQGRRRVHTADEAAVYKRRLKCIERRKRFLTNRVSSSLPSLDFHAQNEAAGHPSHIPKSVFPLIKSSELGSESTLWERSRSPATKEMATTRPVPQMLNVRTSFTYPPPPLLSPLSSHSAVNKKTGAMASSTGSVLDSRFRLRGRHCDEEREEKEEEEEDISSSAATVWLYSREGTHEAAAVSWQTVYKRVERASAQCPAPPLQQNASSARKHCAAKCADATVVSAGWMLGLPRDTRVTPGCNNRAAKHDPRDTQACFPLKVDIEEEREKEKEKEAAGEDSLLKVQGLECTETLHFRDEDMIWEEDTTEEGGVCATLTSDSAAAGFWKYADRQYAQITTDTSTSGATAVASVGHPTAAVTSVERPLLDAAGDEPHLGRNLWEGTQKESLQLDQHQHRNECLTTPPRLGEVERNKATESVRCADSYCRGEGPFDWSVLPPLTFLDLDLPIELKIMQNASQLQSVKTDLAESTAREARNDEGGDLGCGGWRRRAGPVVEGSICCCFGRTGQRQGHTCCKCDRKLSYKQTATGNEQNVKILDHFSDATPIDALSSSFSSCTSSFRDLPLKVHVLCDAASEDTLPWKCHSRRSSANSARSLQRCEGTKGSDDSDDNRERLVDPQELARQVDIRRLSNNAVRARGRQQRGALLQPPLSVLPLLLPPSSPPVCSRPLPHPDLLERSYATDSSSVTLRPMPEDMHPSRSLAVSFLSNAQNDTKRTPHLQQQQGSTGAACHRGEDRSPRNPRNAAVGVKRFAPKTAAQIERLRRQKSSDEPSKAPARPLNWRGDAIKASLLARASDCQRNLPFQPIFDTRQLNPSQFPREASASTPLDAVESPPLFLSTPIPPPRYLPRKQQNDVQPPSLPFFTPLPLDLNASAFQWHATTCGGGDGGGGVGRRIEERDGDSGEQTPQVVVNRRLTGFSGGGCCKVSGSELAVADGIDRWGSRVFGGPVCGGEDKGKGSDAGGYQEMHGKGIVCSAPSSAEDRPALKLAALLFAPVSPTNANEAVEEQEGEKDEAGGGGDSEDDEGYWVDGAEHSASRSRPPSSDPVGRYVYQNKALPGLSLPLFPHHLQLTESRNSAEQHFTSGNTTVSWDSVDVWQNYPTLPISTSTSASSSRTRIETAACSQLLPLSKTYQRRSEPDLRPLSFMKQGADLPAAADNNAVVSGKGFIASRLQETMWGTLASSANLRAELVSDHCACATCAWRTVYPSFSKRANRAHGSQLLSSSTAASSSLTAGEWQTIYPPGSHLLPYRHTYTRGAHHNGESEFRPKSGYSGVKSRVRDYAEELDCSRHSLLQDCTSDSATAGVSASSSISRKSSSREASASPSSMLSDTYKSSLARVSSSSVGSGRKHCREGHKRRHRYQEQQKQQQQQQNQRGQRHTTPKRLSHRAADVHVHLKPAGKMTSSLLICSSTSSTVLATSCTSDLSAVSDASTSDERTTVSSDCGSPLIKTPSQAFDGLFFPTDRDEPYIPSIERLDTEKAQSMFHSDLHQLRVAMGGRKIWHSGKASTAAGRSHAYPSASCVHVAPHYSEKNVSDTNSAYRVHTSTIDSSMFSDPENRHSSKVSMVKSCPHSWKSRLCRMCTRGHCDSVSSTQPVTRMAEAAAVFVVSSGGSMAGMGDKEGCFSCSLDGIAHRRPSCKIYNSPKT